MTLGKMERRSRLGILMLERNLAEHWLSQSFVRPSQKRRIRARLAHFEAEIRTLRRECREVDESTASEVNVVTRARTVRPSE